jgi:hypothetical protein
MCKSRHLAVLSAIALIAQFSAHASSGPNGPSTVPLTIFQVVATPDEHQPFPANNYLNAISSSSSSDMWAVGASTIHFDGQTWTAFVTPDVSGGGTSALTGVADLSPDNVWAVGYIDQYTVGQNPSAIIEHFDGTNWQIFSSPQFPSSDQVFLRSIAALSSTDIWAGGSDFEDPYEFPLLEHFDGTAWTQFSPPTTDCDVSGISADASNDVWAGGVTLGGATCILHYDGSTWQVVDSPNACCGLNYLFGVIALAPNNVWATGWYIQNPNDDRPTFTLIEHWDGSTWQIVSSPNVGPETDISNQLRGITAVSANDIWTFGVSINFEIGTGSTLLEHWNGSSWAIFPSPNVELKGILNDYLLGGTVLPGSDIWIVGSNDVAGTLVIHSTEH